MCHGQARRVCPCSPCDYRGLRSPRRTTLHRGLWTLRPGEGLKAASSHGASGFAAKTSLVKSLAAQRSRRGPVRDEVLSCGPMILRVVSTVMIAGKVASTLRVWRDEKRRQTNEGTTRRRRRQTTIRRRIRACRQPVAEQSQTRTCSFRLRSCASRKRRTALPSPDTLGTEPYRRLLG